jgi:hypothetical protein
MPNLWVSSAFCKHNTPGLFSPLPDALVVSHSAPSIHPKLVAGGAGVSMAMGGGSSFVYLQVFFTPWESLRSPTTLRWCVLDRVLLIISIHDFIMAKCSPRWLQPSFADYPPLLDTSGCLVSASIGQDAIRSYCLVGPLHGLRYGGLLPRCLDWVCHPKHLGGPP